MCKWFRALVTSAMLVISCGGSGDGEQESGAGSPSGGATLLELMLQLNALSFEAAELRCDLCPCGEIVGPNADQVRCIAGVYSAHPHFAATVKRGLECALEPTEDENECLRGATTCDEAEACGAITDEAEAACDVAQVSPEDDQAVHADLAATCEGAT